MKGEQTEQTDFHCEAEHFASEACRGLPFYGEAAGKRYCVLHFPGEGKEKPFRAAIEAKIKVKDFNFEGVWFPEEFRSRDLVLEEPANFSHAEFTRGFVLLHVQFKQSVDFSGTRFSSHAIFNNVRFEGVKFTGAEFHVRVGFDEIEVVGNANFWGAIFKGDVKFREAVFSKSLDLTKIHLAGAAEFRGKGGSVPLAKEISFWNAEIEKPERLSFRDCKLHPEWFLGSDPSKFQFLNVTWEPRTIQHGVEFLRRRMLPYPPHAMLTLVHRRLAANAEENQRFEEASKFRYVSNNASRLGEWRGFAFWKLNWWYWVLSGYGERVLRAALILVSIWLIFAAAYRVPGVGFARWQATPSSKEQFESLKQDKHGARLRFARSLTYSLEVLTFQKPSPPPASVSAHVLVTTEGVLGALQGALLALAVRRKVSRFG